MAVDELAVVLSVAGNILVAAFTFAWFGTQRQRPSSQLFWIVVSNGVFWGIPSYFIFVRLLPSMVGDRFNHLALYVLLAGALVNAVLGVVLAFLGRSLFKGLAPNRTIERDARKSGARPSL